MTERDFLFKLRRGLGGAIVELQENPDRDKYRDIVLRCCLKNIAYDMQAEGTKGYYLYSAICALGEKDIFEDILIDTFMKRLEYELFLQLKDILCLYADDGSEKARNALHEKYHSLIERLSRPRIFPWKDDEHSQFEDLMICEVDVHKWPAFEKCIADAGYISMNRNDDACNCYDWFLAHCRNMFGKERMARFFNTAPNKSNEVKAFVEAMNELEMVREENFRLRVEPKITLDSYIARAGDFEQDDYASARMTMYAKGFLKQASQSDFFELLSVITNEQSDAIRANLLRVFSFTDFPADINLLIEYARSGFERLSDAAVYALWRFNDRRVHDLAVWFIARGNLTQGLHLLINNWREQDDAITRNSMLSSKKVWALST